MFSENPPPELADEHEESKSKLYSMNEWFEEGKNTWSNGWAIPLKTPPGRLRRISRMLGRHSKSTGIRPK